MIKLEEATTEDQLAFKTGLEKLLKDLSLNLTVNIVKVPIGVKLEDGSVKNVFADEPSFLLQKKVEVPDTSEPEAPKITDVEETDMTDKNPELSSTTPTISPFISQPNTDENPEKTL
jgi:hypothetical protein